MHVVVSIAMVVIQLDVVWWSERFHAQCATPRTKHPTPEKQKKNDVIFFIDLDYLNLEVSLCRYTYYYKGAYLKTFLLNKYLNSSPELYQDEYSHHSDSHNE